MPRPQRMPSPCHVIRKPRLSPPRNLGRTHHRCPRRTIQKTIFVAVPSQRGGRGGVKKIAALRPGKGNPGARLPAKRTRSESDAQYLALRRQPAPANSCRCRFDISIHVHVGPTMRETPVAVTCWSCVVHGHDAAYLVANNVAVSVWQNPPRESTSITPSGPPYYLCSGTGQ